MAACRGGVQGLRAVPDAHRARDPARDRRAQVVVGAAIDPSADTLGRELYCYLTTTGRRSGRAHTIEIWFVVDERSLFLISGGRDLSDWVRNLLAGPQATVRIDDHVLKVRARLPLPVGAEREKAVRALYAKYGNQVSSSVDDWLARAYLVALDVEE